MCCDNFHWIWKRESPLYTFTFKAPQTIKVSTHSRLSRGEMSSRRICLHFCEINYLIKKFCHSSLCRHLGSFRFTASSSLAFRFRGGSVRVWARVVMDDAWVKVEKLFKWILGHRTRSIWFRHEATERKWMRWESFDEFCELPLMFRWLRSTFHCFQSNEKLTNSAISSSFLLSNFLTSLSLEKENF